MRRVSRREFVAIGLGVPLYFRPHHDLQNQIEDAGREQLIELKGRSYDCPHPVFRHRRRSSLEAARAALALRRPPLQLSAWTGRSRSGKI